MQRKDIIIIKKVLSEIDICFQMLGTATLDEFIADEKLKRAVAMTVINIGELVKNISDDTRSGQKQVPWKAIAGMRDIAAHKYQTLRMEDVYNTVKIDFPDLQKKLNAILREIEKNEFAQQELSASGLISGACGDKESNSPDAPNIEKKES